MKINLSRRFVVAEATWSRAPLEVLTLGILLTTGIAWAADAPAPRRVLSLDGAWQVEQGGMESAPREFTHTMAVPGFLDMAQPAFAEVANKSELRQAFWYRRTFALDGPAPAIAMLKIHKAKWGTKVFLNDQLVGEHLPCFTPAILDVKPYLKGNGQSNELVIRVGANRESLPEGVPNGWDLEKYLLMPGIYDSVELILTGAPYVVNVQTVPDVLGKALRVVAEIQVGGEPCEVAADVEITEAKSGKVVGTAKVPAAKLAAHRQTKIDLTIPLSDCRLWSPEDPFLYAVKVGTGSDALKVRFGMRSFACDPETRRMALNGQPYYMRGTNVTAYRFLEDANCGDLPWRADWVRKLHQKYKSMNWNTIRYCVGFPPDFWYDIADEEGFLVQDEFPIWLGAPPPGCPAWPDTGHNEPLVRLDAPEANAPNHPKAERIIPQYAEWMRQRWNHPCVVIWDAQYESYSPEVDKSVQAVSGLDLSNRPWENGYAVPPASSDRAESYPHLFLGIYKFFGSGQGFCLRNAGQPSPVPSFTHELQRRAVPLVINAYDWLWLKRDGSVTDVTEPIYKSFLGPHSTVEQRRMLHARYVAAMTESWRSRREASGVLYFGGLGYTQPGDKPRPEGGATCDNFVDLQHLVFEPLFEQHVRDAFSPVGVIIDGCPDLPGPGREFRVVVVNDLGENWQGTVRFRLFRDGKMIEETVQACIVPTLGSQKLRFAIDIPDQSARYQVEAALVSPGAKDVRSLRDFEVQAAPSEAPPTAKPQSAVTVQSVNYGRACEPLIKPAFLPLPPGAVEPLGWLRDWAMAAREGLTGHLDEYHPLFADAWKGIPVIAPNGSPDGTRWPLEQGAYWLDGALRLGLVLHDDVFIKKIRARLDPIVDGVNKADFGTSLIYWKKGYKPEGFNSWAHSHMGRTLVALYYATGDKQVLDALVKVYADYPVNMGSTQYYSVSGLCNLDPMLETYSFSGDQRILDRVLRAIARPDVAKDIRAWGEGRLDPGHMVCLLENIRLPALVYPWSGDPRHLQATLGAFQWLDNNHMLPYGVPSGEEHASGIGAFRKTETCNITAMLLDSSWMYRIQGNGDWGDRMERAFFNAGPAPIARDFKTMCYYQSPNRLRSDSLPCEQPTCPGVRFHRLGCPWVPCCVAAVNRIIPYYIIHMWMATRDNGLAATLYGPCTVSALAGSRVPVKVTTTTDYPFGETIRIKVDPEKDVEFPLYLRIPGWSKQSKVVVSGTPVPAIPDEKGFLKIARTWRRNDVVELELPMEPRVVGGYETEFPSLNRPYFDFEPAAVFQPRRLPYASVLYGPLLFALPIPDQDPNTPVKDAKWQYALDTDAGQSSAGIRVERKSMPVHWDWPLDAPVVLTAPVRTFDWKPTDGQALPERPVTGTASENVRLVPYGCTKFRISMFPVTPKVMTNAAKSE